MVDGEERRVPGRDEELVDVAGEAVPGPNLRDLAIRVAHDHVVAVADALVGAAAPPGQDRPPAVALHPEVGHAVCVEWMEPDEPTVVVHDHRPGLRDVFLRREEDVAGGGGASSRDLDERGPEIRAREEVLGGWPRLLGAGAVLPVEHEPEAESDADCSECRCADGDQLRRPHLSRGGDGDGTGAASTR